MIVWPILNILPSRWVVCQFIIENICSVLFFYRNGWQFMTCTPSSYTNLILHTHENVMIGILFETTLWCAGVTGSGYRPCRVYLWAIAHARNQYSKHNQLSDPLDISASIVQGSAVGPASYVVTASDLHPVSSRNAIVKYADDTYLIIPANNQNTCKAEIQHIEQWANTNNLKLNRSKSKEIVFTKLRSCRQIDLPPHIVQGFERVQHNNINRSHLGPGRHSYIQPYNDYPHR